ncbi:DUF3265 domain-containing protein [Vibrio sp. F13]|nr:MULTISPECIES: DUF3265 domain-containing protein [Vibrio]TKF92184.1 DUF3265 domain-containing protein [Vibrio sp. F13]
MTNVSRQIRNTWRFYYASRRVFTVECGGLCMVLLTT